MKFENMLEKKVNNVEYLGKMLIKQEKEFLSVLKSQNKLFKKMNINKADLMNKNKDGKYELESLLYESSSDEDKDKEEDSDNDEDSTPTPGEFIDDWVDPDDDDNGQDQQDLL